ncbi:MAG: phosphatase PAP2 family protein [Nitrospiraceae bacterium]|nr:phosphatase PAP2 family protein [Nitrospiraceae bacterium]
MTLNQININIFNSINHFAGNNVVLDKIGILIAEYLPIIFILILIFLWFKNKEYKNLVLFCTYSAILGLAINYLISLFYFHPRPFMDKIGILLINHAPETSFPSDHTTFMFSIGFMFLYFKKTRIMGIILSVLALIGGTARVFAGIHYPFDIIGSLLVAIVSSFIIFCVTSRLTALNQVILNLYSKITNNLLSKLRQK